MFRTFTAAHTLLTILTASSLLLISATPANAQGRTADLGIETTEQYTAFTDAIRATEYVRQDFLLEGGAPRSIVTLAGLAAFADMNPLATPEQFGAFVSEYDAALAGAIPDDPDLRRPGSIRSAITRLRLTAGASDPLAGANTDVGARAIALLGFGITGLDGLEQAEVRMTQFDRTAVAQLEESAAFADVLVSNLMGIDEEGTQRAGLSQATTDYLVANGYAPMLGMTDPAKPEVNAGLAALPDFAGFLALKAQPDPTAATDGLIADIESVAAETDAILASIASVTPSDTLARDSAAIIHAAEMGDADALAILDAQQQAIEDRIREVAEERASLFANSLLLMQSDYPDVQFEAAAARDFGSIQLQTNKNLAVAEQSLGILGSVAELAGAYATGNVFAGIKATTDIAAGAIGLSRTLSDEPGPQEQIFNQIVALRQQVEGLRVEMNARFDLVDAKLDTIFQTMVLGFDQLNNLSITVEEIAQSIFEVHAQLSRLEEALFLLAESEFLNLLNIDALAVLEYRDDNGQDLPYGAGSTNFVDATVDFFSFATFTAMNTPFVDDTFALTIDDADQDLGGGVLGRRFGAFNTVPAGLELADGTPYNPGPFIGADLPAPAAWSQPAAMYAQLARENPWYFAYQHASQQASEPGQTDLNRIIASGESLRTYALNMRDPELFEALIENARTGADGVQAAIDGVIASTAAPFGTNTAGQRVDPWGGLDQGNRANDIPGPSIAYISAGSNISTVSVPNGISYNRFGWLVGDTLDTDIGVTTREELLNRLALARVVNTQEFDNFFFGMQESPGNTTGSRAKFRVYTALARGSGPNVFTIVREIEVQFFTDCTRPEAFSSSGPFLELIWKGAITDLHSDAFFDDLDDGVGDGTYQMNYFDGFCGFAPRFVFAQIIDDVTYCGNYDAGDTPDDLNDEIVDGLAAIRDDVRSNLYGEIIDGEPTAFNSAADRLNNAEALLDAYTTLALDDALNRSEILRSALRGFSDVGFRRENVLPLFSEAEDGEAGELGGNPDFDLPGFGDELHARLDVLQAELDDAILAGGPTFPYVEFVLAELNALLDAPADLARGDTYTSTAIGISIGAAEGVLANDTAQPGRTTEVDLAFFAGPDAIAPQHGAISVYADGSFEYTPDAGFTGTDVFSYRSKALIDESPNPVGDPYAYADPALVVVRVEIGPCVADLDGNGVLNFDDIDAFVSGFLAGDLVADLDGNGVLNFDDIDAFVNGFLAGCP